MSESARPQPTRMKSWVDGQGLAWRRIGVQTLAKKHLRRLIHDPSTRVVLFYDVNPTDVPENDRPALWARMNPVLDRDGSGDTFIAVQFRDEGGNVLLGIEERC